MNELQDLIFHDKKIYVVYQLFNKDKVVYVGRSTDFYGRLYKHLYHNDSPVSDEEITHIKLFFCKTKSDMDFTENYFIKKLQPKHNRRLKDQDELNFKINEIEEQSNTFIDLASLIDIWNTIKESYKLCFPDEYDRYRNRWRNYRAS